MTKLKTTIKSKILLLTNNSNVFYLLNNDISKKYYDY